jgi:hypothetical protein
MLKFLKQYADPEFAKRWQREIEVHSSSLDFQYHVYCVAGEDVDGFYWMKIGRSSQPLTRIRDYNYPAHFQQLEIKELVDIRLVAWRTEAESVQAEAYMHAKLRLFRHDAREWFTNYGSTVLPDSFLSYFFFHWASLSAVGTTTIGKGSLCRLSLIGSGLPMIQAPSGSLLLFEP